MTIRSPAALVTPLETGDRVPAAAASTRALELTVERKRAVRVPCGVVLGIVLVGTIANIVIYALLDDLQRMVGAVTFRGASR